MLRHIRRLSHLTRIVHYFHALGRGETCSLDIAPPSRGGRTPGVMIENDLFSATVDQAAKGPTIRSEGTRIADQLRPRHVGMPYTKKHGQLQSNHSALPRGVYKQ